VGGALPEAGLLKLVRDGGFERARVTHRFDCAAGTPREFVARLLGVRGLNLYAIKPTA